MSAKRRAAPTGRPETLQQQERLENSSSSAAAQARAAAERGAIADAYPILAAHWGIEPEAVRP
jgi:hypothetical protein